MLFSKLLAVITDINISVKFHAIIEELVCNCGFTAVNKAWAYTFQGDLICQHHKQCGETLS